MRRAKLRRRRSRPPRSARLRRRPSRRRGRAAQQIAGRKTRVRNLLDRLLWTEAEGEEDDDEVEFDDLTSRLDGAARSPDFETLPIEVAARRRIADIGLTTDFTLSLCETPAEGGGAAAQLADPGARSAQQKPGAAANGPQALSGLFPWRKD
jgi:hypothetical protein